jgi:hypothetical protein
MLSDNLYRNISAKTAAYQILPGDIGKLFTNAGATAAVTLTLPPVADLSVGWWCRFYVAADQSLTIASSGSADNIAAFNDLTADSIAFSTSGEKIGAGGELVWDGTQWLAFLNLGSDAQTPTVA